MRLNQSAEKLSESGVKIAGREQVADGQWIIYFGNPAEAVFPFAFSHCIPIKVPNNDNPELHQEQVDAVMRRFGAGKKPPRKS
jgi:hypothetical protein